jgi:endonuclease III
MKPSKKQERIKRAALMLAYLKSDINATRTELVWSNGWELIVAVALSAQCTDKRVNEVTNVLFKKYPTLESYVNSDINEFTECIRSVTYFQTKARHIVAAAHILQEKYKGEIPKTLAGLEELPGVGRKTANVVLSNLYGICEGIAVDTHVRRLAIKFDLTDFDDPVRIERDLMEIVPQTDWQFINNSMVLYGRYVCTALRHDCAHHPLTLLYPPAAFSFPKAIRQKKRTDASEA